MLLRQYKVIMRTLESKNLGSKFRPNTVWLYDPVQATRPFYAPGFPFVKDYFFYRAIMSVKMRCTCKKKKNLEECLAHSKHSVSINNSYSWKSIFQVAVRQGNSSLKPQRSVHLH